MSLIRINRNPSPRDLTLFGLLWLIFFGAFGALSFFKWDAAYAGLILWLLAIVIPALGRLLPAFLRLVYIAMAYAAFPIGFVISHLLLAFVYYLVLTPTGLLMRLFRYDPMKRKFEPEAGSYWIKREPHTDTKRYFRQF